MELPSGAVGRTTRRSLRGSLGFHVRSRLYQRVERRHAPRDVLGEQRRFGTRLRALGYLLGESRQGGVSRLFDRDVLLLLLG